MMKRRKHRASWGFATSSSLAQNSSNTVPQTISDWIIPPGRVQWLMEQRMRDRLICKAIHLWLDFRWAMEPGSGANPENIPDMEFFVQKVDAITNSGVFQPDFPTGTGTPYRSPFNEPTTPSNVTSWEDEGEADDGTDSFMWSHYMKGSTPPNACVTTSSWAGNTPANGMYGNQAIAAVRAAADGPIFYVCRTFSQRMEWQPDVIIRTARKLEKGEGIALAMTIQPTAQAGNVQAQLDFRARTLVG